MRKAHPRGPAAGYKARAAWVNITDPSDEEASPEGT